MCRGYPVVAVNDACRLLPFANVLYGCDVAWWRHHQGVPGFAGERWSSHGHAAFDDKRVAAKLLGLNLVRGRDLEGFSRGNDVIHYGGNSGFQALNLALHLIGWRGRIALVGFDMRMVDGRRHFFGEHPESLRSTTKGYKKWLGSFEVAAASLPGGVEIVNCTPGSALTCFPNRRLADVLPLRPAA